MRQITYVALFTMLFAVLPASGQISHSKSRLIASSSGLGEIEIIDAICSTGGELALGLGTVFGQAQFEGIPVPNATYDFSKGFIGSTGSSRPHWISSFGPAEATQDFDIAGFSHYSPSGTIVVTGYSETGIVVDNVETGVPGMYRIAYSAQGDVLKVFPADSLNNEFIRPSSMSSGRLFFGQFSGDWTIGDSTFSGISDIHGGATPFIGIAEPESRFDALVTVDVTRGSFAGEVVTNDQDEIFFNVILSSGASIRGMPFVGANPSRSFLQGVGKLSPNLDPIWLLSFGDDAWIDGHISPKSDGGAYFAGSFTGPVNYGQSGLLESDNDTRPYLISIGPTGDVEWLVSLNSTFVHLSDLSTNSEDQAIVSLVTSESFSVQGSETIIPVHNANTMANIVISSEGIFRGHEIIGYPVVTNNTKSLSCRDENNRSMTIGSFGNSVVLEDTVLYSGGSSGSFSTSATSILVNTEIHHSVASPPSDHIFRVYPNPASGFVTLETVSIGEYFPSRVRMFDSLGRIVNEFSVLNTFEKIQVGSLKSGMYHIVMTRYNGQTFSESILVVN